MNNTRKKGEIEGNRDRQGERENREETRRRRGDASEKQQQEEVT